MSNTKSCAVYRDIDAGDMQARVLYLKATAGCKSTFLLAEPEIPRNWKRTHGFLLGMRAAVEGAAEASLLETDFALSVAAGEGSTTDGKKGKGEKTMLRRKALPLTEFANDVITACRTNVGTLRTSTEEFVDDAPVAPHAAFSTENAARETLNEWGASECPPFATTTRVSEITLELHGKVSTSAPLPATTVPPLPTTPSHQKLQLLPSPPHPRPRCPPTPIPPPEAARPLDVAFDCLAHRQVAVREAAVEVLCALALAVGPQTAFMLYERTIRGIEKKRKEELGAMAECSGGLCGGGAGNGAMSGGYRARYRLRCDLVGGLLRLLEQIGRIVWPETVGKSWGRVFSVLR